MHAAMARFWVTARTCSPKRVRCRTHQTASRDDDDEADHRDPAVGEHEPVRDLDAAGEPVGLATATFCAPKISRTVWMRIRLIPQVASSVSSGRP